MTTTGTASDNVRMTTCLISTIFFKECFDGNQRSSQEPLKYLRRKTLRKCLTACISHNLRYLVEHGTPLYMLWYSLNFQCAILFYQQKVLLLFH